MKRARVVAALAAAAVCAAPAGAASPAPVTDTSTNWSGYTVTGAARSPVSFTRAAATWKQPKLTCGPGSARSAIWVGLGGASSEAGELVQIGTDANCTTGKARYDAFYDVTPAPGVFVARFAIEAGDRITATASLEQGNLVALRIRNRTTNRDFSLVVHGSASKRGSAEWIIEAPSGCAGQVCGQADLANFGSVSFTKIGIVGNGHAGTILDRGWQATAVSLIPGRAQIGATGLSHGAAPVALAADGSSFAIVWRARTVPPSAKAPKPAAQTPYVAGPLVR